MKKSIFISALIAIAFNGFAQTSVKKRNLKPVTIPVAKPASVVVRQKDESYSVLDKNFLDPGVGLGTYYKGLPFGLSFEHGITDDISAGAFINYSAYNYADFDYKLNIVYVGIRGSYHFGKLFNVSDARFDPYGGISLGYYDVSFNGSDFGSPYSSTVFFGVHAGARYMFSDNVGGFAEVGYGVSALQVGASFKF
jgi:hypothetical protein